MRPDELTISFGRKKLHISLNCIKIMKKGGMSCSAIIITFWR